MQSLSPHTDRPARVTTLEHLTHRADLECELWQFVQRPAGEANEALREELLLHWREAKRASRQDEVRQHLLLDLAQLISNS